MFKKKNMKKLVLLLAAFLLFYTFTACNSSQNDTSAGTTNNEEDTPVTITYGIWGERQKAMLRQIADEFEKKNPNIKIKIEVTPFKQYWTKLETEAVGKNLPDIFWMNGPNSAKYVQGNILMPITDRIKSSDIDLNNYPKGLVDLYTIDGQQYAIPKDWDTTALCFNKEIFDSANVPYPDNTWDGDKLREVAKQLTNKSKGIYGILAPMEDQSGFYNTVVQAGGFIISDDRKISGYDKPETMEGIQYWIDLLNDGSSPTIEQMIDTKPLDLFLSGKIAMMYLPSWFISDIMNNENVKNKLDLVVMPQLKERGAVIHGLGNVIYKNTEHPDEAWEFVKFLAGKKANDIVAKSGVVIPAYIPALSQWVESAKTINLQAYVDELEYSTMYPCSIDTAKWTQVQTDYLKRVWAGKMSVEDACKKIADEMNKLLEAERK